MSDVAANLAAVRERIARAADRARRDPASIALVAVSKLHDAEAIRAAYDAGQRRFGENYVQELDEKVSALAALAEIEWHFIGHLQRNKVKPVLRARHLSARSLSGDRPRSVQRSGGDFHRRFDGLFSRVGTFGRL